MAAPEITLRIIHSGLSAQDNTLYTMNTQALPILLDPETYAAQRHKLHSLLIIVCQPQVFNAGHIPGSVLVEPAELVSGDKPAVGTLPAATKLSALFSRIGLTPETHVVVYDDEGGGWAGRFIWTLDIIGHNRYSYLDGGLTAWKRLGLPLSADPPLANRREYAVQIDRSVAASKEEVLASIDDESTVVWDARAAEEFTGSKITALRNGHVPGAVNINWLDLMDHDNDLRLLPLDELQAKLAARGITADKKVITHCQTHHRSGLTYLVGKLLGLDIRAYDGSWSEWGNDPETPVATSQ